MVVIYCDKGIGWSPILHMVRLAVNLLNAELLVLEYQKPSTFQKLTALLLRREANIDGGKLLFICPSPKELPLIFQIEGIRKRFNFIAAWVIDSFWVDRIPLEVKLSRYYDHFFITSREDIPEWCRLTKKDVSWLPWGTDALELGGDDVDRKWDLRRVGRQPAEWDDDEITNRSCLSFNISFQGRPELFDDAMKNQRALMEVYRQSKFVLAFSNIANPTNYTHPIRSYLTGRWTDTLACGGIVAGISPTDRSMADLLWEGATLELGTIEREKGLAVICDALGNWSPELAKHNYRQSLKYLDWRWRFMEIASAFQIKSHKLLDDIKLLELEIDKQKAC